LKRTVAQKIAEKLDVDFVLEKPKDSSFGHYATPVFSLAKVMRKSPKLIAEELAARFEGDPMFESVNAVSGYINFKLSEAFLDTYASEAITHETSFAKGERKEKILLEFVSANPTGPLHVGHARGAVYGDALCRMGRHLGAQVTSEYYINDAGNQIELLGLSLYLAGVQYVCGKEIAWPEEFYRGEYITELAFVAKEELGEAIFSSKDNVPHLSEWGKEKMIELVKQNLADAGIVFDQFVSEKSLYARWEESFAKLKAHDATFEKEGKTWMRSSLKGDEKDRVVVREDGRPTYLAGDIIYHDDKFSRKYDRYINIWGADHHGYIARVKAAIAFLGHDPEKLEVLLAQMVSLLKGGEPYKMSKRAGNFILMSDIVDEVGPDALRFIFLSKKCDTHLEFDVNVLGQHDSSNPVYYINYAHARANQVFEKSGKKVEDVLATPLVGLNAEGKNLLFLALLLPEVLEEAFDSRQVQKMTEYLKSLAASFHKFYNENRVVGSENEAQLLKLFAMVGVSIRVGLQLLGITAKARM
jgi:arginyl-tRNA synthetase